MNNSGMSLSKENKIVVDGLIRYGGLNQPNLKFIKVNVDCWERIFDLLSLRDILSISQTCQRMHQISKHYFRENFHGTIAYLYESSSIFSISSHDYDLIDLECNDFLRFVDTIKVLYYLEHLRTMSSEISLNSLTTLRLFKITLNEDELRGLENIQSTIETIHLESCSIDDDSVGKFLASCPNLRSLRLIWVYSKPAEATASLFQRTYPMLEHFQYTRAREMNELMPFLERNPKLKCLEIESMHLLNEVPLQKATTRLGYLNIHIRGATDANELANRLKTLHEYGFFNKLRVSFGISNDDFDGEMFFREIISFSALEVLETYEFTSAMGNLTKLKELHLHMISLHNDIDLEPMAKNLVNLERLQISGSVEQLSSFLRHSKNLKFVFFEHKGIDVDAWNLFNLNRLRQMAGGVKRQVLIGVYEKLYLETKWNGNNQNYDLIEITRADTIRKYFYW